MDGFLLRELKDGERILEDRTKTNFQQVTVNKGEDTVALEALDDTL